MILYDEARMNHVNAWAVMTTLMLLSSVATAKEPPWGPEVNGLRAAVTIDPAEVRIGEEFVVRISIRNVSDKPTNLRFETVYRALTLVIRNEKGDQVRCIAGSTKYNMPMPKEYYHLVKPGETYDVEVRGRTRFNFTPAAKLPANGADREIRFDFDRRDVMTDAIRPGKFTVALRLVVGDEQVGQGKAFGIEPVWTGELASNVAEFSVRPMTRKDLDVNAAIIGAGTVDERREAIAVAAANADRGSVKALMGVLAQGEDLLREAVDALAAAQDTSVLPELMALYRKSLAEPKRDPGPWPAAIIGAIRHLEPDRAKVVAFIIEVLKSDAPVEARSAAIWSLWGEKAPEFVAAIIDLAKKPEPRMQWAAIDALAGLGGQMPRQEKSKISIPLVEILKSDPDAKVRSRAAGALRNAGDPSVAPALVEALKDADLFVGLSAIISLGTLGRPEDIPAIEAWAKDKPPARQKTAQDAIKTIRQIHRATTPLLSPGEIGK
jgi:hypothetical protein